MAYKGSAFRDLAAATPVAVGLGVVGDFAETKVNPTFVGAQVAPLGWGIAITEAVLGLAGAALSSATRDDMWFEVAGEPLWVLGASELGKYATHYVRQRLNAKSSSPAQPAAPKQVLQVAPRGAAPAPAPVRAALAEDF